MPDTDTDLKPRRLRSVSPASGPRTRTRLNKLGHRAVPVPQGLPASGMPQAPTPGRLRVADLFAGIGGFHLAFKQVGAECVFACENDLHARLVYQRNFAARTPRLFLADRFAGDIAQVDPEDVPDHDVLTAGFPCQPFSVAGKQRGFGDRHGLHFFDVARIIGTKRPAAYFLENVKGLVRHDDGQTFATIRAVLTDDLGYSLHARVVRACDFGLPQLRPRLFMVGFRDPRTPFAFPEPVRLGTTLSDVLGGRCEKTVSRTLLASGHGRPYGAKYNWAHYLVDGQVHRLTAREALTLQGFPDGFWLPTTYGTAMRLVGNSVGVPAVTATAKEIARSLGTPLPPLPELSEGRR